MRFTIRVCFQLAAGLLLLTGFLAAVPVRAGTDAFMLFKDGKAQATLVAPEGAGEDPRQWIYRREIPADVPTDLMRAIEEFRRDLRVGYGVELPLALVKETGNAPNVETPNRIELVVEPREPLDEDRTEVTFPEPHVMRLTGGESGVIRTLFRLLETFGGARYLFPGTAGDIDFGAHFPERASLSIPREPLTFESAFPLDRSASQTTYGAHWPMDWGDRTGPINRTYHWHWEARLGAKHRLMHGHDLSRIAFPIEDYAQREAADLPDPDIFPIIRGRRVLPWEQGLMRGHWQPRYSSPAAVEEAVRNLLAFLRENPQVKTLSLAVNDSGGFCETERDDPVTHHYRWVNAVAEQVAAEFPEVTFGVTAYVQVEAAPDFELHPQVVSALTFDLSGCLDPEVMARRKALIRDWAAVSRIGLYHYNYVLGHYSLPRFYFHELQEMLQYLHAHGAESAFCERMYDLGPNGPHLYVYQKLLEDPYLDLEPTIMDWCEAAVGPEAAPHLRAYYAFWEAFWRSRAVRTRWWESRHGTIVWHSPFDDYLYAVEPGDMAAAQKLMERVVALTDRHGTPAQQQRARLFYAAFEWSEALAATVGAEHFAPDGTLPDAQSAIRLLRGASAAYEAFEKALELPHQADWIVPRIFNTRLLRVADPVAASILRAGGLLEQPEVLAVLAELSADRSADARVRRLAGMLHLRHSGDTAGNLVDGAFDDPDHGWETRPVHGTVSRSDEVALRGTHALRCQIEHGNYMTERIVPGARPHRSYYVSARIFAPADRPLADPHFVNLSGRGVERVGDRYVNRTHTRNIPDLKLTPGEWTYVNCIVPTNVREGQDIDGLRLQLRLRNFHVGDAVFIDDLQVRELPAAAEDEA